ncbi:MAG: Metallo-dependent phosphatase-like protein, partial [Podila humilis]
RRTIVVGDIHGSLAGFEGFLTQIGYDGSKDQLILAGDLVAKGPESLQVVDKARALNALCVRGNHDDKVIRWRGYLDSLSPPLAQMRSIPADLVQNSEHHRIAKAMTPEQYQYLVGCPLMLQLPKELSVRKVPVYVVHAGIDPKVELMHQQPWVLTNVRNLLDDGTPYRKKKKGQGWAKVFNSGGSKDFMLVYGHDAGRSVNVKEWSVGLDSGCVYGRSLSGYVVETGEVYSVPCPSLANLDEDFE